MSTYSQRGLPFCFFWHAIELLSQIREDFVQVWKVSTRYVVVIRPLRVVVVVNFLNFHQQVSLHFLENSDPGSFLQQRVSEHFRSSLPLFATRENIEPSAAGFPAHCATRIQPLLTRCSRAI